MIPPAGAHGGDGARVAAALGVDVADVLDLSASMNPAAPDPVPVVAHHLDALGRYPDPAAATAALAAAMEVEADRLLLTNGGAEAIALVAAETGPGWADACDFSLYRRHLERLDPSGPRWRSDPHNPLGTLAGPEVRAAVWDEAFYPLATGRWTAGRPGFAIGSLTKLLACPGLRLGYVVCPDGERRDRLARRQPRWSVNGLACAALPDLLTRVDLPGWAVAVARLRGALTTVLVERGLRVRPGAAANWVLVEGPPDLRARLAGHGVVVRDCASFGLPGVHRIAVPSAVDLPRLASALASIGPVEPPAPEPPGTAGHADPGASCAPVAVGRSRSAAAAVGRPGRDGVGVGVPNRGEGSGAARRAGDPAGGGAARNPQPPADPSTAAGSGDPGRGSMPSSAQDGSSVPSRPEANASTGGRGPEPAAAVPTGRRVGP